VSIIDLYKPDDNGNDNASPVNIYYKESYEQLELDNHFHNSYEIIYIVDGKVNFSIYGKEYNAISGNLIFINNFENHNLRVLTFPYKRYYILIDPTWFQSVINDPVILSIFKNRPPHFEHNITLDANMQGLVISLFNQILSEIENREAFWEILVKSYLQKFFVLLYRNSSDVFPLRTYNSSMETVFNVQKYIEENCTEEINLKKLSELFYIDMYYLSRLFKETTGFKFKEYLILQRISRAKDRLFYANDSITKVCMDSGFNNVNHFIRIFKKYTGTTPHKYRLMNRST